LNESFLKAFRSTLLFKAAAVKLPKIAIIDAWCWKSNFFSNCAPNSIQNINIINTLGNMKTKNLSAQLLKQ